MRIGYSSQRDDLLIGVAEFLRNERSTLMMAQSIIMIFHCVQRRAGIVKNASFTLQIADAARYGEGSMI
jgi:hypothetical protein